MTLFHIIDKIYDTLKWGQSLVDSPARFTSNTSRGEQGSIWLCAMINGVHGVSYQFLVDLILLLRLKPLEQTIRHYQAVVSKHLLSKGENVFQCTY